MREDALIPRPLEESGQRLVVTDYGLAHWLTQNCSLDVNDMSILKPAHMSSAAFDELKQLCKD